MGASQVELSPVGRLRGWPSTIASAVLALGACAGPVIAPLTFYASAGAGAPWSPRLATVALLTAAPLGVSLFVLGGRSVWRNVAIAAAVAGFAEIVVALGLALTFLANGETGFQAGRIELSAGTPYGVIVPIASLGFVGLLGAAIGIPLATKSMWKRYFAVAVAWISVPLALMALHAVSLL